MRRQAGRALAAIFATRAALQQQVAGVAASCSISCCHASGTWMRRSPRTPQTLGGQLVSSGVGAAEVTRDGEDAWVSSRLRACAPVTKHGTSEHSCRQCMRPHAGAAGSSWRGTQVTCYACMPSAAAELTCVEQQQPAAGCAGDVVAGGGQAGGQKSRAGLLLWRCSSARSGVRGLQQAAGGSRRRAQRAHAAASGPRTLPGCRSPKPNGRRATQTCLQAAGAG